MTAAESVTAVIAVLALVVSIGAFVYARRGTIAAEESASTAADALVENRRSADAAVAAAAAAERSADLADEALHPPAAVRLVIEKAGGDSWVLRNVGDAQAVDVACTDQMRGLFTKSGATLAPGEGVAFMMVATITESIPPHLHFIWEGQDEPVTVRVPLEDA